MILLINYRPYGNNILPVYVIFSILTLNRVFVYIHISISFAILNIHFSSYVSLKIKLLEFKQHQIE